MFKKYFLTITFILLPIMATAQQSLTNIDGFRNAKFGMSIEEVKAIETAEFVTFLQDGGQDILAYNGYINGLDCRIFYFFIDNKLLLGSYFIKTKHTDANDYIMDYLNIIKSITAKYGNPAIESVDWKNDLYKDDVSKWGYALQMGYLQLLTSWNFSNSRITISLLSNNYQIQHIITYKSNEYDIQLEQLQKGNNDF